MIFYQELKELRNFLIRLFRGSHDFLSGIKGIKELYLLDLREAFAARQL